MLSQREMEFLWSISIISVITYTAKQLPLCAKNAVQNLMTLVDFDNKV